jgi:futalosine hydrolase
MGLTASTYAITKQLQTKKYDIVIQAGIAGCHTNNFLLGDVVVIKDEAIADMGVVENKSFHTIFDMKLVKPNEAPYQQQKLKNPNKIWLQRSKLKAVSAISVNQISSGKKAAALLYEKYNAVAESMEGAALHYVCLLEQIPFLQIRSFSNYAGERNKKKWQLKKAITNLNKELIRLIESL